MEETRLLLDITFLTAIAGICSILLVKLKFPTIIGYLMAGILLGPTMLPDLWVGDTTVFILSEMGIVLLMFYIGMELNLRELRRIGSFTITVVTINMTTMVMIGFLVGTMLLGLDAVTSVFLGAIISGTSTAVVVGVLHSQGKMGTPESKLAIGVTVLEDIGQVIILTLAAPLLVGESPTLGSTLSMPVSPTRSAYTADRPMRDVIDRSISSCREARSSGGTTTSRAIRKATRSSVCPLIEGCTRASILSLATWVARADTRPVLYAYTMSTFRPR